MEIYTDRRLSLDHPVARTVLTTEYSNWDQLEEPVNSVAYHRVIIRGRERGVSTLSLFIFAKKSHDLNHQWTTNPWGKPPLSSPVLAPSRVTFSWNDIDALCPEVQIPNKLREINCSRSWNTHLIFLSISGHGHTSQSVNLLVRHHRLSLFSCSGCLHCEWVRHYIGSVRE